MKAAIFWPNSLLGVVSELPAHVREEIFAKVAVLSRFPFLYPVRMKGRFRRNRWFLAGDWIVYYRVVSGAVYIRALWPARMP